MQHPVVVITAVQHPPVILKGAMDLFTLVVLAIIIINFLGPLLKAIARALRGATSTTEQQARQRLSQALQQSATTASTASDARRAELDRLRRALLASAGVAEADDDQSATASPPPIIAVQPTAYTQAATPYAQAATPYSQSQPTTAPTQLPGAASGARAVPRILRAPSLQRRITVTTAAPQPAPVTDIATMTPLAADMQYPGGLMTLESAATAFQPLPAFGASTTAAQAQVGTAALGVLQGPNAGMNLFVAAAIIGPCAAARPIGHTPGGW